MPFFPSEDLSRITLLRRAMARWRRSLQGGAPSSGLTAGERALSMTAEGVPLVLPYDPERRLIPSLLRKLRRGRFLRRCPGSLAEYALLTSEPAYYLMDRLYSARIDAWKECVVATWALGRLAAVDPARAEAERLLYRLIGPKGASMTAIESKRLAKRWRSICRNLFVAMTLWGGLVQLSSQIKFGAGTQYPERWLDTVVVAACAALLLSIPATLVSFLAGMPLDRERMCRIRAMAILTLGRWREPRHLDLLLREFVEKSGRIRRAAEVTLSEVLPLLEADEDHAHETDFVPNLCRALRCKERQALDYTAREETLELLLLEALGKVGDGRALPTVERIARRGRTLCVREAAQSILPALQSRLRRANEPHQLLRGAVEPETAPSLLLRPAQELSPLVEQLLRPRSAGHD